MGPLPPLRHVAVVQRNTETGEDQNRLPLPPIWAQVQAALPCHYWEPRERPRTHLGSAGLRAGPNVESSIEGMRLLVRQDADILLNDVVVRVSTKGGQVVREGRLQVVEDLWRSTHRDLGLEAVGGVVPAPEGS